MIRQRLLALMLFSVLGFGCSEGGTEGGAPSGTTDTSPSSDGTPLPNSNSDVTPLPDVGINGPHKGIIWIGNVLTGSKRFNLQTGEEIEVSEGLAIPSRDGSVFLEYLRDYSRTVSPDCAPYDDYLDTHQFNIINTRSGVVTSSFLLARDIVTSSIRLSPDGERIAMDVARKFLNCDSIPKDRRVTFYSKDGKQLFRDSSVYFVAYDWHPDGRLVVLQKLGSPERSYVMQIETAPGSYKFTELFKFTGPPELVNYVGLRVSPTGNDAVLEAVERFATPLTGLGYRDAKAHHFPLFEDFAETDLFVHGDGVKRVNGPTFSPDGKHILVSEGYISGAAVFHQNYPPLELTDALLVVPLHGKNTSYIVSVDVKNQPMPPAQYSETIRPVLTQRVGGLAITGFDPLYNLTWTPAID